MGERNEGRRQEKVRGRERKAPVVRKERNCTSSQARGSAHRPSLTCTHTQDPDVRKGPRLQEQPWAVPKA